MSTVLTLPAVPAERACEERVFVALAALHGAALVAVPSIPVVALGLWWNVNTVSHNFIHRPFFASRRANSFFSAFLSLVLGFPQSFWRARHLAHHAGRRPRVVLTAQLAGECALVAALWGVCAASSPRLFLTAYLPGYLLGLALAALHGRYEHGPEAISHYGARYNLLFFNDGYHAEHHAHPGARWTDLPGLRRAGARSSRWPAVLRWLDSPLESLERAVLGSRLLQRFVLERHARAFERLLREVERPGEVTIVGGGLFPRTALILERLLPEARLTIVDKSRANLETARRFIGDRARLVERLYDASAEDEADLVVVPLAYSGDRDAIYRRPPARATIVHDWIWRPRGKSRIVSWLLVKRLNLIRP